MVLAYALGKGQEVLYHLTAAGFEVAVHGAVASMCALHERLGFAFPGPGRWSAYRRGEVGRQVLLTVPSTRGTTMVRSLRGRRTALLTGWALHPGAPYMYRDVDLLLPLSDHADFDELLLVPVVGRREAGQPRRALRKRLEVVREPNDCVEVDHGCSGRCCPELLMRPYRARR